MWSVTRFIDLVQSPPPLPCLFSASLPHKDPLARLQTKVKFDNPKQDVNQCSWCRFLKCTHQHFLRKVFMVWPLFTVRKIEVLSDARTCHAGLFHRLPRPRLRLLPPVIQMRNSFLRFWSGRGRVLCCKSSTWERMMSRGSFGEPSVRWVH